MRVRVHYNLHTLIWSVVALAGEDKGRVIHRSKHVKLLNAKFHVGEVSRQRVIKEHCRSVHAYISGELVSVSDKVQAMPGGISISYNPYRMGTFYERETYKPMTEACAVAAFEADGNGFNRVTVYPGVK